MFIPRDQSPAEPKTKQKEEEEEGREQSESVWKEREEEGIIRVSSGGHT